MGQLNPLHKLTTCFRSIILPSLSASSKRSSPQYSVCMYCFPQSELCSNTSPPWSWVTCHVANFLRQLPLHCHALRTPYTRWAHVDCGSHIPDDVTKLLLTHRDAICSGSRRVSWALTINFTC